MSGLGKVLVTGAGGFIGSHLVELLMSKGYDVKAFLHYNSYGDRGWLEKIKYSPNEIECVFGDISDALTVSKAVEGCDTVFHLAALIGIPYSYIAPYSYLNTNLIGTLNVLNAARFFECERTLLTSTSEVYGTALYTPIDESHPLQAQSPYSASKISADALGESFFRSFDLPVSIVRPFNAYGPRQSARAIIPTLITQLLHRATPIVIGDERPTRDFNYVEDIAAGFVSIAESKNTIGETINVCTGKEISIGGLAQRLVQKINPDAMIITDTNRFRPKNSEVFQLIGSNSKLKSLTNWKQKTLLDDGLDASIQWFSDPENHNSYKHDIYNI